MHNLNQVDFDKIVSYSELLKKNAKKLNSIDPNDHYWHDIMSDKLVRNNLFIESNMITSWIGETKHPKHILEIGTRTGGSLIALLSTYTQNEYEEIEEILSFDMWREYVSTTPLSTLLSKLMGKKKNINISERITKYIGGYIEKKSTNKVRNNLKAFGIKSDKIKFISGDSKITVPNYFKINPTKKFDYILVDGGHDDYTAECDLENVVNHVAPKGIILFDDIMPESYNLIGVWKRFKEKHMNEFDFYQIEHRKGIAWAVKK